MTFLISTPMMLLLCEVRFLCDIDSKCKYMFLSVVKYCIWNTLVIGFLRKYEYLGFSVKLKFVRISLISIVLDQHIQESPYCVFSLTSNYRKKSTIFSYGQTLSKYHNQTSMSVTFKLFVCCYLSEGCLYTLFVFSLDLFYLVMAVTKTSGKLSLVMNE